MDAGMMGDIDWRDIEFVMQGHRMPLNAAGIRMALRRLEPRILSNGDSHYSRSTATKLTAEQVAERMGTSSRNVHRVLRELPPATTAVCPVCRERIWVLDGGVIEEHPNKLRTQCVTSGEVMR